MTVPLYNIKKACAPRGIGISLDSVHSSVVKVTMAASEKTKSTDLKSGGIWLNDSNQFLDQAVFRALAVSSCLAKAFGSPTMSSFTFENVLTPHFFYTIL